MISAVAVLLAVLSVLLMASAFWYTKMRDSIDIEAFGVQITRLIMANNPDRAIKLCNSEPNVTTANWAKTLLTRANKPYALEFLTHEIWAKHQSLMRVTKLNAVSAFAFITQAIFFALLYAASMMTTVNEYGEVTMQGTEASTVVLIAAIVSFTSDFFTRVMAARYRVYLDKSMEFVMELRTALYLRKNYKPPLFMPPRHLTSEETEAWRKGLTEVDKKAVETSTPPEEIYDDYIVNDVRSPFRKSD